MAMNQKQNDQKQTTPRQGEAKTNPNATPKGKTQTETKQNKPAARK